MTSRQQRRAAEHKTRKLASKAIPALTNAAEDVSEHERPEVATAQPPSPARELSPARLAANRANAQLSRGPVSPEGKANSSRNALLSKTTFELSAR